MAVSWVLVLNFGIGTLIGVCLIEFSINNYCYFSVIIVILIIARMIYKKLKRLLL